MSDGASDTISPPANHAAAAAAAADGQGKRKSFDGGRVPRAKRNRYISIACNECKRRKIKCNGQTPCQRCGNLSLECLYAPNCCNSFKDSDDFKRMDAHISHLQAQVDDLFSSLAALRATVDASSPSPHTTHHNHHDHISLSPLKESTKYPPFYGPTSSAFNLGVAPTSLQTMGITSPDDKDPDPNPDDDPGPAIQDFMPQDTSIPPSGHFHGHPNSSLVPPPIHTDKDPIWSISRHEALRLVHVWYEEQGIMYPIVDMARLLRYTEMLFSFVEAATHSGLMQTAQPGPDTIMDDETSVLKLILAIALVLEGRGKDPLGERLFENVQSVVNQTLSDPVSLHGISLLALAAMYHFTRDDEAMAWRVIGLAARHCLELGLHRRETYPSLFPDPDEEAAAIRTFWCIYVLDRRWSFGTGMPFALQDADIDASLPKPDVSTHESSPYLNSMIAYSTIGSKVWKSVSDVAVQDKINKEDVSFLDFQVLNWHRSIPSTLKFAHPDSGIQVEPPPRTVHRLQVVLYLRANQMRILIYRPVLHTAATILENLDFAQVVVKVAKDTIRILTHINQTSDIYRSQQTMFNYFLISALAVLFLAVAHAPAEFGQQSRDEFYMALELVRGLSSDSYVSKRLWRTIKTLKQVGPRLGLAVHKHGRHSVKENNGDAHSSAAVAMAGLAGHPVDELVLFASDGRGGRGDGLGTPHSMASDLTTLFEAAGGMCHLNGYGGTGGSSGPLHGTTELGDGSGGGGNDARHGNGRGNGNGNAEFGHSFASENDELARIMRDLF